MRCPVCEGIVPAGSNCFVEDGTSFTWDGTGEGGDGYILVPELSADVDQLLVCGEDGLLAEVPLRWAEPPAVRAYSTVAISIANNTLTALTFNTELYDTDTMWSSGAPTRVTFTTAGVYLVTMVVAWDNNIVGDRFGQIRKNGTDVLARESKDTGDRSDLIVPHNITIEEQFAAADYVEVMVQQTSGAALLIRGESYSPYLSAVRVA